MADRQLDLFEERPAGPAPPAAREAGSPAQREAPAEPVVAERLTTTWAAAASAALESPVEVVYGRSRHHPVQLERGDGPSGLRYRLRLHRVFATAPDGIRDDLLAWLRAGRRARRASARLDAWIAQSLASLPPAPRRALKLDTAGEVHDLARAVASVTGHPSAGPVRELSPLPPIGWGRWPTRPPRRRLQLGAFDAQRRAVRIHPVLDDASVPATILEYVVFHELLHAAVGDADGRRHHGPTFRAAERAFEGTAAACEWIDARTPALIKKVARRTRRRRKSA